ncbi:hypothetical protein C8J56DRAFT_968600 [Mycena floridula]|nr:hypothetical protein C8J56DRAFT_968600 [Mycena floridula]
MGPGLQLLRMVSTSSVAALWILLWDLLLTFDREIKHIWLNPPSTWIKWLFIFARYFPIAVQSCNRGLEFAIFNGYPLSENAVRIWHAAQVLVVLAVTIPGEVVLMARGEHFHSSRKVAHTSQSMPYTIDPGGLLFMCGILLAETVIVFLGFFLNIPRDFNLTIFITNIPQSFAFFAPTLLATQLIILGLSLNKYFRTSWGAAPLVKVIVRDGTLAFMVATGYSVLTIIYTLIDVPWAASNNAWLITFASITECRLILNMQTIATVREIRSELQLTTVSDGTRIVILRDFESRV